MDHHPRQEEEVELALLSAVGQQRETREVAERDERVGYVGGGPSGPVGGAVHHAEAESRRRLGVGVHLAGAAKESVAVLHRPQLLVVVECGATDVADVVGLVGLPRRLGWGRVGVCWVEGKLARGRAVVDDATGDLVALLWRIARW